MLRNQLPWKLFFFFLASFLCGSAAFDLESQGRVRVAEMCLGEAESSYTVNVNNTSTDEHLQRTFNGTSNDDGVMMISGALEEEEEKQRRKEEQQLNSAAAARQAEERKQKPADDLAGAPPISEDHWVWGDPQLEPAYQLKLKEVRTYERNFVNRRTPNSWNLDRMSLALCKNRHPLCVNWAVTGQCEDNPSFMRVHCASACFTCDDLAAPNVVVVPSQNGSVMSELLDSGGDLGVLQNFPNGTQDILVQRELILQSRAYLRKARQSSTLDQELVDICRNRHPECSFWAMRGECENNPTFMKHYCAPACQSCHEVSNINIHDEVGELIKAWPLTDLERGADMGLPQLLHPERPEETIISILSSRMYIRYFVFDQNILEHCKNERDSCTIDAMEGECEANPGWMKKHCAAACKTCEVMEKDLRCASDPDAPMAWMPGDLNSMFERLIDEPYASRYDVQVLSSPTTTKKGPYVIQLEDFISEEEANGMIAAANKDGYGDQFFRENFRTAKIATCQYECYNDEIVRRVSERINALTGFDESNCEYLHLPR